MTTSRDGRNDAGKGNELTVLSFLVAGNRYCVDLEAVDSVVGVAEPTSIEDAADPWNAGEISIEEATIRIVDLSRIVGTGGQSTGGDSAVIVLSRPTNGLARYGWLVDEVGVSESIQTVRTSRTSTEAVRGRVTLEAGSATMLDEEAMHG